MNGAALYGPTHFGSILNYVNEFCQGKSAEESQYNQKYNILLILTDGAIMDLQATINSVVAASGLPLSIIIIGVGDADFSTMEKLDADREPLYSDALRAYQSRDVVQFVQFNQFRNDNVLLAREVLKEIPKQMTSYFQSKKIRPNPASPEVRAA